MCSPTTRYPCSWSRAAATEESTPPLMATSTDGFWDAVMSERAYQQTGRPPELPSAAVPARFGAMALHNLAIVAFGVTRRQVRLLETGGYVMALIGAIVLVVGNFLILRAVRSRSGAQRPQRTREKVFTGAGFALIGTGLFVKTLSEVGRIVGR